MTKEITAIEFNEYLKSLNIDAHQIISTPEGFYAHTSRRHMKKMKRFTSVRVISSGLVEFRLSRKDLHNPLITEDFFDFDNLAGGK